MTGRTHVTAGVAVALLAAGPAAGLPALALAAGGGAVGATIPDLDVRDPAHPHRDRLVRVASAALLVAGLAADAASGGTLLRAASAAGAVPLALGALGLAGLLCATRLSSHRAFSHSLLALAGYAAATHLLAAPLALPVALGFASHLALDALNHRAVRLLWPLRGGVALGLCRTGGVVDSCALVAALAAAGVVLWRALA